MDIQLKKLKHHSGLSEETNAFSAELHIAGNLVAHVSDNGQGGSINIRPLPGKAEIIEQAETYCKGLPADESYGIKIDYDLELFIGKLVDEDLKKVDIRKGFKKLTRLLLTKHVLVNKSTLESYLNGETLEFGYRTFDKRANSIKGTAEEIKIIKLRLKDGEVFFDPKEYKIP